MKTFIYSIVFALTAFTAIVLSADINCSNNNNGTEAPLIPDPKNCSRYYMCANNDPILRECPDNLQFNPKAQVCDFPSAAGCIIKEEGNHNSTNQENHENHGNSTNQENHNQGGSNEEHPKKEKCFLWIFFCHYE